MLPESPQDIPRPEDPVPRAPRPPRPEADESPGDAPDDGPDGTPDDAPPAAPDAPPPELTRLVLAGFLPRGIAFLVDFAILALVESVLLFGSNATAGGVLWIVLGGVYQWYFLVDRDGQTPGKMLMRIRVVKVDGKPLQTQDALLRYLGYVINALPFLFGLGWAWAVIDARRQGWHDKLARTLVITTRPPEPSG